MIKAPVLRTITSKNTERPMIIKGISQPTTVYPAMSYTRVRARPERFKSSPNHSITQKKKRHQSEEQNWGQNNPLRNSRNQYWKKHWETQVQNGNKRVIRKSFGNWIELKEGVEKRLKIFFLFSSTIFSPAFLAFFFTFDSKPSGKATSKALKSVIEVSSHFLCYFSVSDGWL